MSTKKIMKLVQEKSSEILQLLGITELVTAEYEISENEGDIPTVKIVLSGDDVGFLIGHHGQHLESMQFIISMIVNKQLGEEKHVHILLDAGGYLDDRLRRIESIAMTKADDSRIIGEPVHLHPMNSFERRIVHTTLGKFDDIETSSEGEGRDRHVVITPKSDETLGIGESESLDGQESEEE